MSNYIIQTKIDDAVAELPKKLKHERAMSKELKSLFSSMGDEFYVLLSTNQITPNFDDYRRDMESLLKQNYRKVSKDFKRNLRDKFGLGNEDILVIDEQIKNYIDQEAKASAGYIINTTNDFSRRSVIKARREGSLARQEVVDEATKNFRQYNNNRIMTIAETEVQKMSERAKLIEASSLSASGNLNTQKTWNSVLDKRTRPDHALNDGQIRDIDKPFNIGGWLMMTPGDTSLGAPLKEIINCRCSITYRIRR